MKKVLTLALTLALALVLAVPAGAYGMGKTGQNTVMGASGTVSAVVDANGGLWTWGSNYYGQVGNDLQGNTTDDQGDPIQSVPTRVLDQVISVGVGGFHIAALKADGTLWTWGSNDCGQLGIDGRTNKKMRIAHKKFPYQSVPKQVLDNVAAVAAGEYHTAAILSDGTLWTWGDNSYGQLGTGGEKDQKNVIGNPCRKTPAKVMDDVAAVAAGLDHTVILKTDGTLWTCGANGYGQLGIGTSKDKPDEKKMTPVKVMDQVAAVSAGDWYTLALKTDGTLWAWGVNDNGQLGNGGGGNRIIPTSEPGQPIQDTPVKIMDDVASMSVGSFYAGAVKTDGTLWMWGSDRYNQLGTGAPLAKSYEMRSEKTPVQVLDQAAAVYPGNVHTLAARTDGSVWVWGADMDYLLGTGSVGNLTSSGLGAVQNVPAELKGLTIPLGGMLQRGTISCSIAGKEMTLNTYTSPQGDTYIRLRDAAQELNGTDAQFSVAWKDRTVVLTTGQPYTGPVGTEGETLTLVPGGCRMGETILLADGAEVTVPALKVSDATGGGNTFLALKDLGTLLGVPMQ